MIWCSYVEVHQPQHRVQESLGLSQRQAENHAQRQRRHDCEIRVARLGTAAAVVRWRPSVARLLREPDRDVATAPEATLVLPPVGHAILRLVFAVHSAGLARGHRLISSTFDVDQEAAPKRLPESRAIRAPTPFAGDYSGGLGLENKIEPLKLVDEEEESLSPLD